MLCMILLCQRIEILNMPMLVANSDIVGYLLQLLNWKAAIDRYLEDGVSDDGALDASGTQPDARSSQPGARSNQPYQPNQALDASSILILASWLATEVHLNKSLATFGKDDEGLAVENATTAKVINWGTSHKILYHVLHCGVVKYDPLLQNHYFRLIFLSKLKERVLEGCMASYSGPMNEAGLNTVLRRTVEQCVQIGLEATLKAARSSAQELHTALTKLKLQTQYTQRPLTGRNLTISATLAAKKASPVGKVVGEPGSTERVQQIEAYKLLGGSAVPCPKCLPVGSSEWYELINSRGAGVDLHIAKGSYERKAQPPPPDTLLYDQVRQTVANAEAAKKAAAAGVVATVGFTTHKLIVSPTGIHQPSAL